MRSCKSILKATGKIMAAGAAATAAVMPAAVTAAAAIILLSGSGTSAFDRHELLKDMYARNVEAAEKKLQEAEGQNHPGALLRALQTLATAYENANRLADAEVMRRRIVVLLESGQPVNIAALSSAQIALAFLIQKQGQYKQAEELFLIQLERASHVKAESDRKGLSSAALSMLASNDFKAGNIEKAEARLKEGMAMAENRYITDVTLLASIKASQGKPEEAETLFKEAMQRAPNTVATMTAYGEFLEKQNRVEEARAQRIAIQALKDFQENMALASFITVKAMDSRQNDIDASEWGKHMNAARKAQAEGNFDAVLSECRSALKELGKTNQTKLFKDDSWNWISNTAASYQEKGEFKKAAELYAVMVPFANEVEEVGWQWSPLASLASASLNARNFEAAEQAYRKASPLFPEPKDHFCCMMLMDLALTLEQQKKYAEAEVIYKDLLANRINEKLLAAGDAQLQPAVLVQALLSYAVFLKQQSRDGEAAKMVARAQKVAQRPELADQFNRLKSLAASCQDRGQLMEAARALQCAQLIKPYPAQAKAEPVRKTLIRGQRH